MVDHGPLQLHLASASLQQQIAIFVSGYLLRSVERERNNAGVGAGGHNKVILQLALVTIVDDIDALVDFMVVDASVGGHISAPVPGILADEVVALAGQLLESFDLWRWVGSHEFHSQDIIRGLHRPFVCASRCQACVAFLL